MAAANFTRALRRVLTYEGRLSMDRNDRGNWTSGKVGVGELKGTKFGISAMAYPDVDIRNLTEERAGFYYRRDYWHPVGADALAHGVDLAAFDAAVNSGVRRARRWRDAALARAAGDAVKTVKALCSVRRSFLLGLGTFTRYGRGWLARVADVEATGVRWALAAAGRPPAAVKRELERESHAAEKAATVNAGKGRIATAGAATSGGAATVPAGPDQLELWILIGVAATALAIVALIFRHRTRAERERRDAYALQAATAIKQGVNS